MDFIQVGGISVRVVKKRIKNMYFRVDGNGIPTISAPLFLSDREVEEFALSREQWLKDVLCRTQERRISAPKYEDGETVGLFGKEFILRIDETKKNGYYLSENEIILHVGKNSTAESREKALANFYREALEQILPDIAKKCQEKCGLYANEWRVRDMKTRWGSCNTREKRIWISLWLVAKPIECIIGVIYHELAHLKVKGHGKEFYAFLNTICPDYDRADRMLKNK